MLDDSGGGSGVVMVMMVTSTMMSTKRRRRRRRRTTTTTTTIIIIIITGLYKIIIKVTPWVIGVKLGSNFGADGSQKAIIRVTVIMTIHSCFN